MSPSLLRNTTQMQPVQPADAVQQVIFTPTEHLLTLNIQLVALFNALHSETMTCACFRFIQCSAYSMHMLWNHLAMLAYACVSSRKSCSQPLARVCAQPAIKATPVTRQLQSMCMCTEHMVAGRAPVCHRLLESHTDQTKVLQTHCNITRQMHRATANQQSIPNGKSSSSMEPWPADIKSAPKEQLIQQLSC